MWSGESRRSDCSFDFFLPLLPLSSQSFNNEPNPMEVMFEKCDRAKVDVPIAALTFYNEIIRSDHELSKKTRLGDEIEKRVSGSRLVYICQFYAIHGHWHALWRDGEKGEWIMLYWIVLFCSLLECIWYSITYGHNFTNIKELYRELNTGRIRKKSGNFLD